MLREKRARSLTRWPQARPYLIEKQSFRRKLRFNSALANAELREAYVRAREDHFHFEQQFFRKVARFLDMTVAQIVVLVLLVAPRQLRFGVAPPWCSKPTF